LKASFDKVIKGKEENYINHIIYELKEEKKIDYKEIIKIQN
jgi:hypothetical protein